MKPVGLLFPGQGSQFVGMGRELADTIPEVRSLFAEADAQLGFGLSTIMLEGPDAALMETRNTQPAIYLHSAGLWMLLDRYGLDVRAAAGHSLGEYSALHAAGALDFREGLEIVRLRGELMYRAGLERPGAMAAILGLDSDEVAGIAIRAAEETNFVSQAANFNAPGQTVVSGEVEGVERAMELARSSGARRAVRLPVSGAFHSELMEPAATELAERLAAARITDPSFPIVANSSASPLFRASEIRSRLEEQLTQPVRWVESIEWMIAQGITDFLEVGPGKVLAGLLRKIDRRALCRSIFDPASLDTALEGLRQ
ncbi:MAG: [acyl-carrier-protein] S-malonyltransferase [Gemmatimonadetes bacterium]|nr:[acyl-carrier-protein] S-malonyltransferase [Gemmatimonadota bacterium]